MTQLDQIASRLGAPFDSTIEKGQAQSHKVTAMMLSRKPPEGVGLLSRHKIVRHAIFDVSPGKLPTAVADEGRTAQRVILAGEVLAPAGKVFVFCLHLTTDDNQQWYVPLATVVVKLNACRLGLHQHDE